MDKNQSLLPWYINHTLYESEKNVIEAWLQRDSDAKMLHQEIQQFAQIISGQETKSPPTRVRTNLLIRVREQPSQSIAGTHPWVWGIPLMLLIFLLLWLVVQPVTQLRWSTSGNLTATFRIYRAPAGSGNFSLIKELPASPTQQTYQFADLFVVPGQDYQYIIEISDQSGNTTISQTEMSNSLMTLAAQIAILLTSFMLTFGIITVTQEIKSSPQLGLLV